MASAGPAAAATGAQWARMMVILMAMQGIGRPGVNFGNMQIGTPIDFSFWFPGYAEGGISGDLMNTGARPNTYQRIPHILTMNTSKQMIPRLQLPEAILEGKALGYLTDPLAIHGQFLPFEYPAPGHSPDSDTLQVRRGLDGNDDQRESLGPDVPLGKTADGDQPVDMDGGRDQVCRRHPAGLHELRARPTSASGPGPAAMATSSTASSTIGSWCSNTSASNRWGNRSPIIQIFLGLAKRLGLSAAFSEGMTEIDWCKRIFEGSDLSQCISWKEFLKKGYYVVPAGRRKTARADRLSLVLRRPEEGRARAVPAAGRLFREMAGRVAAPEREVRVRAGKPEEVRRSRTPAGQRYIPSWEGTTTGELLRSPACNSCRPYPL